jgi:hypothetical protein
MAQQEFYTILTSAGLAYEANRKALGLPIKLVEMSVGDGNGAVYNPGAAQTALAREVWRGPINALLQDATNPSYLVGELSLPDDVGGWYVREVGFWTDSGILYAIGKYPESFKPQLATGAGKEFYIRAIFETSNAESVTLVVDDTVVKATRAYVVDYVAAELAKRDRKNSVRVATTAAIVLTGPQSVDGVAVVAGDRVLVKNQADGTQNGIYVAAVGAWSRAADADASIEVTPGLLVPVEAGAANGDSVWQLVTDAPIALGATALAFEMLAGRTGISAGTYRSVTVDKYGRITGGTNPTTLAGYGITDALKVGSPSTQHPILAASQEGTTYQHTALEVREALADSGPGQSEGKAPSIGWHWGGLLGMRMWMSSAGRLMWGSSAFHTTTTGATQEEAETGENQDAWMSPLRVFQAIAKKVVQATETVLGVAKVATSVQVNAGADDATIVTPKKLRLGFSISPGINGFIALPSWLGGFIFQWGRLTITQSAINAPVSANWIYTLAFPANCFSVWAFQHTLGGNGNGSLLERLCGGGDPGLGAATFYIADADAAGSYTLRVFAIGN